MGDSPTYTANYCESRKSSTRTQHYLIFWMADLQYKPTAHVSIPNLKLSLTNHCFELGVAACWLFLTYRLSALIGEDPYPKLLRHRALGMTALTLTYRILHQYLHPAALETRQEELSTATSRRSSILPSIQRGIDRNTIAVPPL